MPNRKATPADKRKAFKRMVEGGMSGAKAQEILKMYAGGMTMNAAAKKVMGMGGYSAPKKMYGSKTKPVASKRRGGATRKRKK